MHQNRFPPAGAEPNFYDEVYATDRLSYHHRLAAALTRYI